MNYELTGSIKKFDKKFKKLYKEKPSVKDINKKST